MKEYGITTSKARVWFHVCPLDCSVYWYSTARMLAAIDKYPEREIASARGRLVRLNGNRVCDGGFIFDAEIPLEWIKGWRALDSDTQAGALAERVFEQCVETHRFYMPARATRYEDRSDQFQGKDYRLTPAYPHIDIEVKADFVGGEWGTGNLFVQTHEAHHQWAGRNLHREAHSTPG